MQLSRLEKGHRRVQRRMDLLIRLAVAVLLAARDGKPTPNDLAPLVEELEVSTDVAARRLKHLDGWTRSHRWQPAEA